MTRGTLLAAVLAVALPCGAACARVPGPTPEAGGGDEVGLASYYADRFEGRRTASGEPYAGAKLTCAHRTHPFGAVLEVTELASGRSVRVRVNDRGPFTKGRIVDLSKAAAEALGILGRGVARVRVVRVG